MTDREPMPSCVLRSTFDTYFDPPSVLSTRQRSSIGPPRQSAPATVSYAPVQAVQAGKLGGKNIYIAGSDTDAANANYLCEGKQAVEVFKDIKPLAEKAAEVAAALAYGKPLEGAKGKPPMVAIPVHLVNKDNARQMLVDSGFHPASAVPACMK